MNEELKEAQKNLELFCSYTCIGSLCYECSGYKECLKILILQLEQVKAVAQDILDGKEI